MQSHPVLFAMILLLCAAVLSGCTLTGDEEETREMEGTTIRPGANASLPLVFEDVAWDAAGARVAVAAADGLDVEVPERLIASQDALLGWVTLHVPAGTDPGTRHVRVSATNEAGEKLTARYQIEVAEPNPGFAEGDTILMHLTIRTTSGEVAFTNDPAIAALGFPVAPGGEAPGEELEPFPVQLVPSMQIPEPVLAAMMSGGAGHRVQTNAPEFYGPLEFEGAEPREESVPRVAEHQRVLQGARQAAVEQGAIAPDAQVGDPATVGGPLPYVIEAINESEVRLVADVDEGDRFTLYEAWPLASVVTTVGEDAVRMRTDPDVEEGAPFTWREGWSEASRITHMDEEEIRIRHSPAVGTRYEKTDAQGATTEAVVERLEDDEIVVTETNPHPLAGEDLFFEIELLGLQEQSPAAPGSGGTTGPSAQ